MADEVQIRLILEPTELALIDASDSTGLSNYGHDELIRTLGALGFDIVEGPERVDYA